MTLLLVLAPWTPTGAQTSGNVNLGIDHFGLDAGLPGTYIPDMALTQDGLLWLSVSGRLVSFDGQEFEEIDLGRFPTPDKTLRGVARGRGDTLWVTVGQSLYSYVGGRVAPRAEYDGKIRGVRQDSTGQLWVWDDRGALRLGDTGFERVVLLAPGLRQGEVHDLRTDAPANLWLHDPEQGSIRRFNARWVLRPLPFPEAWPLPLPADRAFLSRTEKNGTAITRLDGTPITRIPPGLGDWPFLRDRHGLVWTQASGSVSAVDASGKVVASLPLAPGARPNSAVQDAEGDIWLGTVTDGLYRIRQRPVRVVGAAQGLTDGEVLSVSAGPNGSVIALQNDGRVAQIGPDGVHTLFESSGRAPRALSAFTDRRGTVWLQLDLADGRHVRGRTADGRTIDVRATPLADPVEDPVKDGQLWLLEAEGFFHVRPYAPGGPVFEGPYPRPKWDVRRFLVDPDSTVWATGEAGLARITPDGVQEFLAKDDYPTNGRSLYRTADGDIWIGRYTGGIVRYRDGKFEVVRAEDGLWDDGASDILDDGAGNLWMSSNRGVHRVALSELDAFLDGRLDRVHGRGYGPDAGFRNAETSGFQAHRSPDGRLWFPTFSGVAVIDPKEALAQEQTPGIRLRSVRAGSDVLPADSALILPRGRRRIEVTFGAILLSGQAGVRYEVRLDGVDNHWVDEGSQRQVTYGSLPPGRHVFHVRAVSGAGVPGGEAATMALTVPPYFYETGTFLALVAVLAGAALWLIYHLRVRGLQAREATLRRLVDERTRDLAHSQRETETALATVEAQADELRSLDEAKSRFFANVSHELRTPLTLVQGPLQDVMDGRLGPTPDAVREQVSTVLASSHRLGELVEQLLDVARLESGEMRLHMRREDLKPLLVRLAASFGALARNKGIDFVVSLPEGGVDVEVDADQIEKVYGNLLANAFKFTPEGGRVGFTAQTLDTDGGRELVVTVEDDGPGIPPEQQERIFERFHQVDDSSRRTHGGAGLGLALVREIAELHGGSADVWSEPGRGSRFTVRVPIHRTPAGTASEDRSPPPERSLTDRPLPPTRSAPSSPVTGRSEDALREADDTERPTVLVVEDHDELRAYLRRHLEDDYRVVEVGNGHQGLEEARRAVPDLILCDIMMPEMDGEELCRAVRADPELSFLPVVMVTAKASRESRLSALEGGADDYLVKPFDPEELRLRVGNLLAARRRLAERLAEAGEALPFISLQASQDSASDDFTAQLDAALRERMADETLDVDVLAKALAMSRATLYRKAEEAMGASPMELLWDYRLKEAAHLLDETDANVSEVAYACGFKTVPHFTRRFKERFGTTPGAYRSRS